MKKLEYIAKEVYDKNKNNYDNYPDCYDISEKIRDKLLEETSISEEHISIVEVVIDGFRHYVLDLYYDNQRFIVDGSFSQFSSESETPISLCSEEEISDVVVVNYNEYVFAPKIL